MGRAGLEEEETLQCLSMHQVRLYQVLASLPKSLICTEYPNPKKGRFFLWLPHKAHLLFSFSESTWISQYTRSMPHPQQANCKGKGCLPTICLPILLQDFLEVVSPSAEMGTRILSNMWSIFCTPGIAIERHTSVLIITQQNLPHN